MTRADSIGAAIQKSRRDMMLTHALQNLLRVARVDLPPAEGKTKPSASATVLPFTAILANGSPARILIAASKMDGDKIEQTLVMKSADNVQRLESPHLTATELRALAIRHFDFSTATQVNMDRDGWDFGKAMKNLGLRSVASMPLPNLMRRPLTVHRINSQIMSHAAWAPTEFQLTELVP